MEVDVSQARDAVHEEARKGRAGAGRLPLCRSDRRALRSELAAELGIGRDALLLDLLIDLGIEPETAPAFEALPVVEVAWADGRVDAEERWRALAVATAFGLELGRPAHALLACWLRQRPEDALFDAWTRFAAHLWHDEDASRVDRVLAGVHEVAEASGGILGLGAISGSERAAIGRIGRALGRAPSRAGADS